MPRNWSAWHERNIIRESVANWSKLTPGQIVRFNYSGEHATRKRPLVLVLNPNYDGKLHGIILDYISDDLLVKLRDLVHETTQEKARKLIGLRLPLLKADIKDPQRFYERRLRPFIRSHFKQTRGEHPLTPYRTYIRKNIRNLRVIDYRFKDFYVGQPEKIKK